MIRFGSNEGRCTRGHGVTAAFQSAALPPHGSGFSLYGVSLFFHVHRFPPGSPGSSYLPKAKTFHCVSMSVWMSVWTVRCDGRCSLQDVITSSAVWLGNAYPFPNHIWPTFSLLIYCSECFNASDASDFLTFCCWTIESFWVKIKVFRWRPW